MKILSFIWHILRNKFVLITLIFLIWVAFFDKNSILSRYSQNKKLQKLKDDRQYFMDEIIHDSIAIEELKTNDDKLEKYARERYLMKKDSEDIFLVVKPKKDTTKLKK